MQIETVIKTKKNIPVKTRKGTINFFDAGKNYGSVRDSLTRHNYIFYLPSAEKAPARSNCVHFEIEKTTEGLVATKVRPMARIQA